MAENKVKINPNMLFEKPLWLKIKKHVVGRDENLGDWMKEAVIEKFQRENNEESYRTENARDIGGTGDPHTWGGREPYEDDEEPAIDTRDGSEFEEIEEEK